MVPPPPPSRSATGQVKKHEIYMAAFGGHLFITYFARTDGHGFFTLDALHCYLTLPHVKWYSVADPGFSPGGGANSQKCYYFSIFCRKLHENERIWTPGGGASLAPPPLDPPMVLNSGRLQNVETIAKLNPSTDFSDIHNWPQGTNSLRQKLTGLPSLLLSHPSSPNHEWNLEECHTLSNSANISL